MPSTTPTTAKPAQTSIGGELSRSQRAILWALRRSEKPLSERKIRNRMVWKTPPAMSIVRDDLAELESRMLVKCEVQPNGRRIWGMP